MPKAQASVAHIAHVAATSLAALETALAAFRAHGATATAMVAKLTVLLDRCAAIPTAEWDRWLTAQALYLALRRGTVPTPLAPHVWPWRTALRTVEVDAFPLIIRVRSAYGALDDPTRDRATAQLGRIHNGGLDYSPVWVLGGWPRHALRDLDTRAASERLDIVPLMATSGALWAGAGIQDDETIHKRRQVRRRMTKGAD